MATNNHCNALLQCIESVKKYTDLTDKEVIIVATGCTDNTWDYMHSLSHEFKRMWIKEEISYTTANNHGIEVATGEFIILLRENTMLLPQAINNWTQILMNPFIENNRTGIAGPVKTTWNSRGIQHTIIEPWCMMFKKELIKWTGPLDDSNFFLKTEMLGHTIVQVPINVSNKLNEPYQPETYQFPIFYQPT